MLTPIERATIRRVMAAWPAASVIAREGLGLTHLRARNALGWELPGLGAFCYRDRQATRYLWRLAGELRREGADGR